MKIFFLTIMLLAATTAARAFDFTTQAPTGQWLYYTITDNQSVKIVNPNWDSHTAPAGLLEIPSAVANEGSNYNVTAIDNNAFSGCDALTAVVIPEGVATIGRMAFAACTTLDSLSLPSTLTAIGSMAFTGTAFFSSDSHINAEGLLIAGGYIIGARRSITGSLTVPEEVQGLGDMAFYSCDNLERITLPEGLRFIGQNVFQDCLALDTVEMLGTTPPTLASNAFSNVQSLTVLVPCQSAGSYLAAESWSALTIEEHCPAGIAATAAAMVTVSTTGGGILISGGEGQHFFVSDIIGHRVTESNGGFVALPAHGIYFVSTMGMKTHKVVY